MQHKAAEKIHKKIKNLSTKDELDFWKKQTELLRKRQEAAKKLEAKK